MTPTHDQRATYRFDPHDEGIWIGLGLGRLSLLCGALLAGAAALYGGQLVVSVVVTVLAPPIVLARWEGLPLLLWLPLRTLDRAMGPREWSLDPEFVAFTTALPTAPKVPATDKGDR